MKNDPFKCRYCDKEFDGSYDRAHHERIVHSKLPPTNKINQGRNIWDEVSNRRHNAAWARGFR